MKNKNINTVLVTGGAGYVGCDLVPKLLNKGYNVKVLDLYMYGDDVLDGFKDNKRLTQIKGDIRDTNLLEKELANCDAVLHLACISNDPSFELNPNLSKSINYEAFEPLVKISKSSGVKRFIYVSTCSVYGVSDAENVTEDHPLVPITDYNKYKGLCEPVLLEQQSPDFTTTIIRPATVCGYSTRQRLDLTVNILTNHAFNKGKILVFGGKQTRPNIHIDDITNLYVDLLEIPESLIAGKIYNVGSENLSIEEVANRVKKVVETETNKEINVDTTHSDDIRSYRISSEKIKRELGFVPKKTIEDGARDILLAFKEGKLPNSFTDTKYFNVKRMQEIKLI